MIYHFWVYKRILALRLQVKLIKKKKPCYKSNIMKHSNDFCQRWSTASLHIWNSWKQIFPGNSNKRKVNKIAYCQCCLSASAGCHLDVLVDVIKLWDENNNNNNENKWLEKVVTTLARCCCSSVCFRAPWMSLCCSGCSCWNLSGLGLTSQEARGSRPDYILVLGRWSSTLPPPGTLWWWPGVKMGKILYAFNERVYVVSFFLTEFFTDNGWHVQSFINGYITWVEP